MNNEKKLLKWIVIYSLLMVVSYVLVLVIMNLIQDHALTERCIKQSNYSVDQDMQPLDVNDLVIRTEPENMIEVTSLSMDGNDVIWTVKPTMKGSGGVFVTFENTQTGEIVQYIYLRVNARGLIINMNTSNFSHFREKQLLTTIFLFAFSLLLWAAFVRSQRTLRYSYHSIFCSGLGLWTTIISILLLICYEQNKEMMYTYNSLSDSANIFATYTFPFILLFAVLLSASNIALIRHEGFRLANALGIIISLIMVIGFFGRLLIRDMVNSGSETEIKLWETFTSLFDVSYALLECFLIGSIICGTLAARGQPAFDKDYIIILGCKIRKDGSLYPLIRGRVDRAIRFYKDQEQKTGRKAVFIPSGGKGKDEPLSEGEAMARYLMEQGIKPEQISAETASASTKQNMLNSMRLMEPGKKAIFSTTNYHVFRSGIIASQIGFDTEGIGSKTKWYFWPNAYVREVIGMLSYKWRSLVVLFIPIVVFLAVVRFSFS